MRWTDLPRDPEPARTQDRAVVQRGEWEDLRRRLERLPAGHPSSPDEDGAAAEARAHTDWTDDGPDAERTADQGGDERARDRDGRVGPDRRAEPDAHGRPGPYHAGLTRGPEQREPYRPWFASGDWPDPWFSADTDA